MSGVEGKSRRQALTEFREAEILQAARKVFGEQGFTAATVDLIAAEAGVAKGTLYLYYTSKEDIFWKALSARFGEMFARTRSAVEQETGVEAKLRAALRVRFEFLRSDEQFLRMYLTEFGPMSGPAAACNGPMAPMRELYQNSARYYAEVLEEGMRSGELRKLDALESAMALMELTKAVFAMRFSGLAGQNQEFDGERFVFELFWSGVRNPECQSSGALK